MDFQSVSKYLFPITLVGLTGVVVYEEIRICKQQDAINSQVVQQKQLIDGITRSQLQFATKDGLDQLAKDNNLNLKAIQDDLATYHAEIKAINILKSNSNGYVGSNIKSTDIAKSNNALPTPIIESCPNGGSVNCPIQDQFGYLANQQNLDLFENFDKVKVPLGSVGFNANSPTPWNENLLPREYSVITTTGVDENSKQYFYNKFSVKVSNQEFDLPITTSTTAELKEPANQFKFFNPKLLLTAGGSVNLSKLPIQGSANIGAVLGIMSYGKYNNQPMLSVLQVGLGYQTGNHTMSAILNPIAFNIGMIIPGGLINNTYVAPSVQLSTNGDILTGINLGVGF